MPFAVSFTSKPTTASSPNPEPDYYRRQPEVYLQMYDLRRDSETLKTHPEHLENCGETTHEEKRCLHLYPKSSIHLEIQPG